MGFVLQNFTILSDHLNSESLSSSSTKEKSVGYLVKRCTTRCLSS